MAEDASSRRLPSPPDIERRARLHRHQWVAIPLLVLVPVLAAIEVFGPVNRTVDATQDGLSARLEYPVRTRYGRREALHLTLRADRESAFDSVFVRVDPNYMRAFRDVRVGPELGTTLAGHLEVLSPGEAMELAIYAHSDRAGLHRGTLRVSAGRTTLTLPMRTFIFP